MKLTSSTVLLSTLALAASSPSVVGAPFPTADSQGSGDGSFAAGGNNNATAPATAPGTPSLSSSTGPGASNTASIANPEASEAALRSPRPRGASDKFGSIGLGLAGNGYQARRSSMLSRSTGPGAKERRVASLDKRQLPVDPAALLGGVTGTAGGVTGLPLGVANGLVGTASGLAAPATGLLGTADGLVNGLPVVGAVAGTVTNTLGGVVGTVGGLAGGVLSPVTNTLGGLTNSLGLNPLLNNVNGLVQGLPLAGPLVGQLETSAGLSALFGQPVQQNAAAAAPLSRTGSGPLSQILPGVDPLANLQVANLGATPQQVEQLESMLAAVRSQMLSVPQTVVNKVQDTLPVDLPVNLPQLPNFNAMLPNPSLPTLPNLPVGQAQSATDPVRAALQAQAQQLPVDLQSQIVAVQAQLASLQAAAAGLPLPLDTVKGVAGLLPVSPLDAAKGVAGNLPVTPLNIAQGISGNLPVNPTYLVQNAAAGLPVSTAQVAANSLPISPLDTAQVVAANLPLPLDSAAAAAAPLVSLPAGIAGAAPIIGGTAAPVLHGFVPGLSKVAAPGSNNATSAQAQEDEVPSYNSTMHINAVSLPVDSPGHLNDTLPLNLLPLPTPASLPDLADSVTASAASSLPITPPVGMPIPVAAPLLPVRAAVLSSDASTATDSAPSSTSSETAQASTITATTSDAASVMRRLRRQASALPVTPPSLPTGVLAGPSAAAAPPKDAADKNEDDADPDEASAVDQSAMSELKPLTQKLPVTAPIRRRRGMNEEFDLYPLDSPDAIYHSAPTSPMPDADPQASAAPAAKLVGMRRQVPEDDEDVASTEMPSGTATSSAIATDPSETPMGPPQGWSQDPSFNKRKIAIRFGHLPKRSALPMPQQVGSGRGRIGGFNSRAERMAAVRRKFDDDDEDHRDDMQDDSQEHAHHLLEIDALGINLIARDSRPRLVRSTLFTEDHQLVAQARSLSADDLAHYKRDEMPDKQDDDNEGNEGQNNNDNASDDDEDCETCSDPDDQGNADDESADDEHTVDPSSHRGKSSKTEKKGSPVDTARDAPATASDRVPSDKAPLPKHKSDKDTSEAGPNDDDAASTSKSYKDEGKKTLKKSPPNPKQSPNEDSRKAKKTSADKAPKKGKKDDNDKDSSGASEKSGKGSRRLRRWLSSIM